MENYSVIIEHAFLLMGVDIVINSHFRETRKITFQGEEWAIDELFSAFGRLINFSSVYIIEFNKKVFSGRWRTLKMRRNAEGEKEMQLFHSSFRGNPTGIEMARVLLENLARTVPVKFAETCSFIIKDGESVFRTGILSTRCILSEAGNEKLTPG